jgi:cAMP-dependent protein kinase regulator
MFGSTETRALRRLMARYQATVRAAPRDLDTRLLLADVFRRLGRDRDAEEELGIVAKLAARAGHTLTALATLHAILEIDPHHRETLERLASITARAATTEAQGAGSGAAEGALAVVAREAPREDDDEEHTHPSRPRAMVHALLTPAGAQDRVASELACEGTGAPQRSGDEGGQPREAESEPQTPPLAREDVIPIDDHDIVETTDMRSHRDLLPLFSTLSAEALAAMIPRLRNRRFSRGERICDEHAPGDSLFLLVAGRVRIEKDVRGTPTLAATLEPGAFFGEFGYLTDHRRHAGASAETDVEILEATREVIDDVARSHPEIRDALLDLYGRRLLETTSLFSPVLALLPPTARRAWLDRFERRSFARGAVVLAEGSRGEGLFILLAGDAVVEKQTAHEGGTLRVGALKAGDFFGEVSWLTGRPVMATVRAETALDVLRLPPRELADLLADHPKVRALLQAATVERKLSVESLFAGRAADALAPRTRVVRV